MKWYIKCKQDHQRRRHCCRLIARSTKSDKIKVPVPGYTELAVNLMATAWNENCDLRNASTLGSAKTAAKKVGKNALNLSNFNISFPIYFNLSL